MTLVCDGCEDDIEVQRPKAAVPLSDGGVIDLCVECTSVLDEYCTHTEISDAIPNVYRGEVRIEVHEDGILRQVEGERE